MDQSLGGGKAVRASFPAAPGKIRGRAERGRICEHDGCETVLSTYNSERTCWMHQPESSGERRSEMSRTVAPLRLGSKPMASPAT